MNQLKTALCTVGRFLVNSILLQLKSCCYSFYSLCRVDIESKMTIFAYYYAGIGVVVLFTSYFQVCIYAWHILRLLYFKREHFS